ncbi:hypothetical protein EOL70_19465 [Leucothrix sargassi]|nr:hypothetical protein EOL70_19465 [Leucothrix sargassi]
MALATASLSILSTVQADDSLSLENRLKEFNQPTVVIERTVVSKKTTQKVKTTKVKQAAKKPAKSKRSRKVVACYEYSPETLRLKANAYQPHIRNNSVKYGVDEALIIAVITAESCFRQRARSPKSAQGLMQLIPATAKRFGVSDAYEPAQNIRGGTRYLKFLIKRFSGNLSHAVAGYNAGEGAVDRYSGIPPYRETKEYVRRVLHVYNRLKGRELVPVPQRARVIPAVNKTVQKPRGNFIKPDYKWRKQGSARTVAVATTQRQQQVRTAVQTKQAYVCRDTTSSKIRRSSNLIKRTNAWRRFYTVKKPMSLSSISKQTGVGLNHLLTLNRGISRLNVKVGREVLVWQCVNS